MRYYKLTGDKKNYTREHNSVPPGSEFIDQKEALETILGLDHLYPDLLTREAGTSVGKRTREVFIYTHSSGDINIYVQFPVTGWKGTVYLAKEVEESYFKEMHQAIGELKKEQRTIT